MKTNKNVRYMKGHTCPECGGKINKQMEMFISECDRCLAKKSE